jgi:hypothetical protein
MHHVEENAAATPRPQMKHQQNPKSNRPHLPSCGAAENATPTQRKNNQKRIRTDCDTSFKPRLHNRM